LNQALKGINDHENLESELKKTIQNLHEENNDIRNDYQLLDNGKRLLEETFQKKVKEIERVKSIIVCLIILGNQ
jgi:hypothetical protein